MYRLALLAAALLAGGCTDASGPAPPASGPGAPEFAVAAATPIVFDRENSKLGEIGTTIWQGFHPTNPHVGDAIIVTFFWPGSTNIVTSVIDYLVDGTPVGNTYTLVEYVTAGGLSMATYVATNVQNFPDPNPDQNKVLVVQANLSSPIPDGGAIMSAYSGVNAVSAWAVGAHQSTSGSGSSPSIAAPGAITAGAGALAYAVTLADTEVGIDAPIGFSYITNISDPALKADARYAVQGSVGPVAPQWTWYFDSPAAPRTWLATVLALNPSLHFVFTVQPSTTLPYAALLPHHASREGHRARRVGQPGFELHRLSDDQDWEQRRHSPARHALWYDDGGRRERRRHVPGSEHRPAGEWVHAGGHRAGAERRREPAVQYWTALTRSRGPRFAERHG